MSARADVNTPPMAITSRQRGVGVADHGLRREKWEEVGTASLRGRGDGPAPTWVRASEPASSTVFCKGTRGARLCGANTAWVGSAVAVWALQGRGWWAFCKFLTARGSLWPWTAAVSDLGALICNRCDSYRVLRASSELGSGRHFPFSVLSPCGETSPRLGPRGA